MSRTVCEVMMFRPTHTVCLMALSGSLACSLALVSGPQRSKEIFENCWSVILCSMDATMSAQWRLMFGLVQITQIAQEKFAAFFDRHIIVTVVCLIDCLVGVIFLRLITVVLQVVLFACRSFVYVKLWRDGWWRDRPAGWSWWWSSRGLRLQWRQWTSS